MCSSVNYLWDVGKGDILYLGSRELGARDVNVLSEQTDAVRSLCNKVLNSPVGNRIATDAYKALPGRVTEPLSFAVGFDEINGLLLFVNGASHAITTAENVFRGEESYFEDIKEIVNLTERKKLGNVRSDITHSNDEAIQKVYKAVVKERREDREKPLLMGRLGQVETFFRKKVDAILEKVFGVTDVIAVGRNTTSAISPTDMTSFGTMAILGGGFLTLGGFYSAMASAAEFGVAVFRGSREKGCLAFSNMCTGICATMIGLLFVMKGAAFFAKDIAMAAVSGFALPFFVFGMYVLGFITSVYKIYVSYTFRKELEEIVENEGTEAAIKWIEQKMQLSHYEDLEKKDDEVGLANALHQKLDQFALRVGMEVYDVLAQALDGEENLSELLEGLERRDPEKIEQAEKLIALLVEKSKEQVILNVIGAVYNLLGAIAMGIFIGVAGHTAAVASSTIFAIAAFISIFIDMQTMRNVANKIFTFAKEDLPGLVKTVCDVAKDNNWDLSSTIVALVVMIYEKMREEPGAESEESDTNEECDLTTSPSSSSTSKPNGGSHPTRLNPMQETSGHSLDS